jgi:hypothetical protein
MTGVPGWPERSAESALPHRSGGSRVRLADFDYRQLHATTANVHWTTAKK